ARRGRPARAGAGGQRTGALGEGGAHAHGEHRAGGAAHGRAMDQRAADAVGAPPRPARRPPRRRREHDMSSVQHGTFTLERVYPAPPARVFAAWSDPEAKAQWFGGEDFSLDFRVGGTETNAGGPYRYEATYRDIV